MSNPARAAGLPLPEAAVGRENGWCNPTDFHSGNPSVVPKLSAAGTRLVQELSQRHGLSADAVTHMLIAVQHGNGTMAQFSHPEFGGSGQWMRGGMTMVSNLFNHQLKSRVDNLCNDIASALAKDPQPPFSGSSQSQSQSGTNWQSQASGTSAGGSSLFDTDPQAHWWPDELGTPSATGSQNHVRYAYFPQSRRLAVTTGGDVWVYDTQDHQIGGFSQQQGRGGSITFTSQYGTVDLSTLPVVSRGGGTSANARPSEQMPSGSPTATGSMPAAAAQPTGDDAASDQPASSPSGQPSSKDIIETLERLGDLLQKGYITDEEFATKKADLLSRL